jgi:hypothetical protein
VTGRPEQIPYDEIAEIVREWPSPRGYGPHIAQVYRVPLATARRWVYQTRLRGLLPAGTGDRPCPSCQGSGVANWGARQQRRTA